MNTVAFLTAISKAQTAPRGWQYNSIEDFVLQNGQHFMPRPLPEGIRRGPPGRCFCNALRLLIAQPELIYVEGYANCTILHAWCVDGDGNVYDPTWPLTATIIPVIVDSPSIEYFGVPFQRAFVLTTAVRKESYGIIDNEKEGFPLLKGIPEHEWKHNGQMGEEK